jgi:opacity protein-like surface antigen
MRQQNLRVVITLMLSLLCWVPGVWAEPYVAAYAGFSLLSDTDLNADVSLPGAPTLNPVSSTIQTIRGVRLSTDVDNSAIVGGKIGYWFDFFPLVGAELDIYGFSPDINVPPQISSGVALTVPFNFNVSVTAISFNLMGRYPLLKSPAFPRGRIQPYIGIGPGLFITSIEDLEPNTDFSLGSKTLAFGGLQVIGGLKFFLLKKLSLFAEYKFTHFTADLSGLANDFSLGGTQNIDASHFYGGVAYHFY